MKITTKDIAKLAGVSRGTVDRALNNRGQIAPQIKAKILKIAKDHGYKKNLLASSLAKNKDILTAIVLPDPAHDVFWEAPLGGIKKLENYVNNYGLKFSYHHFNIFDKNNYTEVLNKVIAAKPQAIIIAPVFLKESLQFIQIAKQNNIQIVCINSELIHQDVMCYIGQNSYACGQLAGKLFNLSGIKNKSLAVVTLGHSAKNAIHIKNKTKGLEDYLKSIASTVEIKDYLLEDIKNKKHLAKLSDQILSDADNLAGMFFTNSRAHNFLNNTNFKDKLQQKIIKVGFDLIPQNIALLKEDHLDFILNQNPQRQGYLGVINLFNHFIFNKALPQKRYLPVDIVVKENHEFYLTENENSLDQVF